jgi:hypothetical protein
MTTRIRKRLKKDQPKIELTSLSSKELKQLKAKIDFLLNNTIEDVDDYNYSFFYGLLTSKLGEILHTSYQPFPLFKKQKIQYNKLVDVVDYLDELMQTMFEKPKKVYYRKLYRMFITLVIQDIQDSPIPLQLPIILNYKSKFPAILDDSFPGYLESGLFKRIFKNN